MIVLIILGYTITAVLALLILLLLLIIFVPFEYKSHGFYKDNKGMAAAFIKWFFGFVCLKYEVDENLSWDIDMRIFWLIPVNFRSGKEKSKEKRTDKEKKKKKHKNNFSLKAIKPIIKSAKRALNSYMPNKFKLHIVLGFDDPYQTGLLCAYISPLQLLNKKDSYSINIQPFFAEQRFEGSYTIEGKVVVSVILIEFLKVKLSGALRKERKN